MRITNSFRINQKNIIISGWILLSFVQKVASPGINSNASLNEPYISNKGRVNTLDQTNDSEFILKASVISGFVLCIFFGFIYFISKKSNASIRPVSRSASQASIPEEREALEHAASSAATVGRLSLHGLGSSGPVAAGAQTEEEETPREAVLAWIETSSVIKSTSSSMVLQRSGSGTAREAQTSDEPLLSG